MALLFADATAGKAIFEAWQDRLGEIDVNEELRLSIITGIDRRHPFHYRIAISGNPELWRKSVVGPTFIHVSKSCQMEPKDPRNLEAFLSQFKQFGRYRLVPAFCKRQSTAPTPFYGLGIEKKEIHVRPAWQIDENDIDISVLQTDDCPIIPRDAKDPPVVRALRQIASRRGKNTS